MVKVENYFFILAKDGIEETFEGMRWEYVGQIESKDLVNLEYEPLYKTNNTDKKAHYVISGDFITTQEGTSIVHIAPAFGEDDSKVGQENNLPTLLTVDTEGKISADVPGKGIPVKKKNAQNKYVVDELIIEDLKKRGLLFKEELYEHDYPFCWRCETPLIYYAKPSWFVRMSAFREIMEKNNQNINWIPEHIKEGRFGEWLRDAKDWAISRDRYWGTPLPIWKCKKCGKIKVVESIDELEKLSGKKLEDLHKPFIDEITFQCKCGEEMRRELEVMDVWFDSGSMPTAQYCYPFGEKNKGKPAQGGSTLGRFYPADYICEAVDQTRGWFYTLHAISTLLNEGKKVPTGFVYKNVICLGHILDKDGKKMSKSKGNIVDPMEIMDKYGADMLRWMLYTINQPGLPKRFDVKKMNDVMNRVFRMLWNSYSFFVMYANIDKFKIPKNYKLQPKNLLDKWVISELNVLIKNVDEKLNSYDIYSAGNLIEKFIDNLSNWYIRRSRKRFWKSENDKDKNEAYQTLYHVLVELSKLMAPFTPFIAEEIYKNLTGEESVHLAEFPKADGKLIDEKSNDEMRKARETVRKGLQRRAEAGIRVRQPLSVLSIKYNVLIDLFDIIKEEVNVKSIAVNKNQVSNVILNIEITEDLKLEGQSREIIRHIQEMRKESGYEVDNRIEIAYSGMSGVFEKFGDTIKKETLANSLDKGKIENADLEKEFEIDGEKLEIDIKKP